VPTSPPPNLQNETSGRKPIREWWQRYSGAIGITALFIGFVVVLTIISTIWYSGPAPDIPPPIPTTITPELDPDDARAYYNRGRAYLAQGQFAQAIADFDQAIAQQEPRQDLAYYSRGVTYYRRGLAHNDSADFRQAIEDFTKITEQPSPEDETLIPLAYHNRGLAHDKLGQSDQTVENFKNAIELNPAFVDAYISLGMTYARQGRPDLAIAEFARAEEKATDSTAWFNLGKAYTNQGQFDKAVESFTKVITLDRDSIKAHIYRGQAYLEQEEAAPPKAVADFIKAVDLIESPSNTQYITTTIHAQAYLNLGLARIKEDTKEGSLEEAIGHFNTAISITKAITQPSGITPTLAYEAYNQRGLAHAKLGQSDQAVADLTQAIQVNPDDPLVHNNRGLAHFKARRFDEAIADFDKTIKITKVITQPPGITLTLAHDAYYNRGRAYAQQNDFDQAIDDFNEAIQLQPDNATAYVGRGEVYFQLNDLASALADFNTAIDDLASEDAAAYISRGEVYFQQNDLASALADFNTAIDDLASEDAAAYIGRGEVYFQQNDFASAVDAFNVAIDDLASEDEDNYYHRGLAHAQRSMPDLGKAICDLKEANEFADEGAPPKDSPAGYNRTQAYYNLGLAYYQRGLDRAEQDECEFDQTSPLHSPDTANDTNEPTAIATTIALSKVPDLVTALHQSGDGRCPKCFHHYYPARQYHYGRLGPGATAELGYNPT
jgi:tetratricopeptide (TPR) repeat protein